VKLGDDAPLLLTSLMTADVATGFVVLQVTVEEHELDPAAMVQLGEEMVPVIAVNEAVTVQLVVIAPVVYVVPDNDPLHPEAEAVYPEFGVTVNVVVVL
jgi:hypothetical protein